MSSFTDLPDVNRSTLEPIVRKVFGSDAVEVVDWNVDAVKGSAQGATLGISSVHRVAGTATVGGRVVPWSVVAKVIAPPKPGDDWNFEADTYRSGLVSDLPHDLVAPRCFDIDTRADGTVSLWLEDVADLYGSEWPIERYGLAGRHLGQFSGFFLTERPLPELPWLRRDRLRTVDKRISENGTVERVLGNLDHPLMRRAFPQDVVDGILRLWRQREALLAALDRLPQTLCHHDAFRRNLLACHRPDGREQTVAIDWAWPGISALGVELAALVSHSILFQEVGLSDLWSLEEMAFEGYLDGLRDVGWRGDERLVRLGYTASTALKCCWPAPAIPVMLLDPESFTRLSQIVGFSAPPEEVADRATLLSRLAIRRDAEARALLSGFG